MFKDTFDLPETPVEPTEPVTASPFDESYNFWQGLSHDEPFFVGLSILAGIAVMVAFALFWNFAIRRSASSSAKKTWVKISTFFACVIGVFLIVLGPNGFAAPTEEEVRYAENVSQATDEYEQDMADYETDLAGYEAEMAQYRIDNKEDLTYNLKLKYNIDDVIYTNPDYPVYSADSEIQKIIVVVDGQQILFDFIQDKETSEPTLLDPLVEAGSTHESTVPTSASLLKTSTEK